MKAKATSETPRARTPAYDGIHVLALIDHFALGGAETMLTRFALAAPSAGIRLSVACLHDLTGNPAAEPLREQGRPPVNLGVRRLGPDALRAVRNHLVSTRAQLIHTHLGGSDMLGGLVARRIGVPAVGTIHSARWGGWRDTVHGQVVRRTHDRILAVSDSARIEYLRHGWATPGQVVTVRNGIDATVCRGSGAAVRRHLGLDPEDQVVMMVSALRPEKGHDMAIDAVLALRARHPRLRLVIAGRGDLSEHLNRRAQASGGAVVLAGYRTDVLSLFDAADVCLHPSQHDALPTTLIEAMAASVPIIATAVGGIPEIITDGREGVLVRAGAGAADVSEALSTLLTSVERRRALGSAGRRRYEMEFTLGPWLERTRTIYDQVLAARDVRVAPRLRRRDSACHG